MKTIQRPGARVAYEISGDGPPLLLGHSLLCNRQMWNEVLPALQARHRVINVDARGHGESTADAPFTLDDLVSDWLAILDHEEIEQTALCGLSMGGMVAMRLALVAPKRVTTLALLDTSAESERGSKRLQFRLMAEILRSMGPLSVLLTAVSKLMFGPTTLRTQPALVAQQIEAIRQVDRRAIYFAVRAVTERPPVGHRLAQIRCPTLVVVGEEDRATPPVLSERIAAAIPNSRLVRIPRAGHLTALEAPQAVIDALATQSNGSSR